MKKIFAICLCFALFSCENGGVTPPGSSGSVIDETTSYLTFLGSNYDFNHVFSSGDTLSVSLHYNIAKREYCDTCLYGLHLLLRTSSTSLSGYIVIDTLLHSSGDTVFYLPFNNPTDQYSLPHLISVDLFQKVGASMHSIANLGIIYGN